MTYDVMTADEARALLADVAPRRVCAMCGAINPPTARDTIGGEVVDVHDGCPNEVRGRIDVERGLLRYGDALRALRSVVALHGRLEAPQRPQASPDGGVEPRGDGAPARGLPVAPWWERVRVVTGADPLCRAAASLVVGVALGALGLPEPHVEVVDGDVVLTWQSADVTATVTVRDGGTRTRLWCDDGGPRGGRGVEVRTLDLAAHGAIPAWWVDVARRCPAKGPRVLPWWERLPPLPSLDAAAREALSARVVPALAALSLPAAVVRPLAGGVDMCWRSMRSDGTTPSTAWLTIRGDGTVRVWREDDHRAEEPTGELPSWWVDTVRAHAG